MNGPNLEVDRPDLEGIRADLAVKSADLVAISPNPEVQFRDLVAPRESRSQGQPTGTTEESAHPEGSRKSTPGGGDEGANRSSITTQISFHVGALARRLEACGYAPTTVKSYVGLLGDFGRYLDTRGIDDVRGVLREHVEGYARHLLGRRLSSSTRSQSLRALARLFDDLVDRGVLLVSPAAGVAPIHRRTALPRRVPSEREVRQLIAACNVRKRTGLRDRSIIEVLYGSALRVGELVALSIEDVALDDRLLRIERGKGARDRVVPLTAEARRWLERYLDEVRPWWARRCRSARTLYLTNRSEPITSSVVRQMLVVLCDKARLARLSPHALRHAAATHLVRAGADVRYVQKLLGHAQMTTTQVYTRVAPMDVKHTHAASHPREQVG